MVHRIGDNAKIICHLLKIKSLKKVFETNKYDISEIITNEVLGYIGDYDV